MELVTRHALESRQITLSAHTNWLPRDVKAISRSQSDFYFDIVAPLGCSRGNIITELHVCLPHAF